MAVDPNRFSASTVRQLLERASSKCSNPQCRRATHGPAGDDVGSVNIGVAAHIYGANPGSARYDSRMKPEERSTITNGIWLCNGCAKLIDDDERTFTVSVLYEWKRIHEDEIRKALGYAHGENETLRRISSAFVHESGPILQIALDKPQHWEWLLFIHMWRDRSTRIRTRHGLLLRGLLYRPVRIVHGSDFAVWMKGMFCNLRNVVAMLSEIISVEIPKGIGPDGQPGDEFATLEAMQHLEACFEALLAIDMEAYYARWDDPIDHLRSMWHGTTPFMLDQLDHYPNEMERRLRDNESGDVLVSLEFPNSILDSIQMINETLKT